MRRVSRLYYLFFVFILAGAFVLVLHGCQGIVDPKKSDPKGRGPLTADPNNESRKLNHFVILIQENRSFDTYFGQLSSFWAANGFPSQAFDGMPGGASNQGCDPTSPAPGFCVIGANSQPVSAFHLQTACMELVNPDWNESHVDLNHASPASGGATMDGFVESAGGFARAFPGIMHDTDGRRAMGFYDGNDLNYYYFMASNFGTSDAFFSPVMAVTQPNRMYFFAATSHGHVFPLFLSGSGPLSDKTIFQLLDEHGVSWKIYVHPDSSGCTSTSCLVKNSYINMFAFQGDLLSRPQNIVPISQYFADVKNGTLPQVAYIDPASAVGLDEHPSALKSTTNMQVGAQYASSLINALMHSSSWKDSAFILTFDEAGGLFDHVAPMSTVNPDGIPPSDLKPGDVCFGTGGSNCDFTLTGFRVPLIVISPFAKRNFVSHNPADYTAILRLLEHRFSLPSLTARDAFQMDMTEFFDFDNPPWMNPPNPPAQNVNLACYKDHLP
ncbi:MAG TPA: alkaline phosphatase family protein [Candidatus Angelobacter sp.]|nr:alkaline phosphatase family protein [Candidatus Angelobacter sp.]